MNVHIKYLFRKVGSISIKKKIFIAVLSLAVIGITGISACNYYISRNAIIDNSESLLNNLIKQVGVNLDDRINAFRDISYRIVQPADMMEILSIPQSGTASGKKRNEQFSDAILQQTSLYRYTKAAYLENIYGDTYQYHKSGAKSSLSISESDLLEYMKQFVRKSSPVCWVNYEGSVYFVRLIVGDRAQEMGMLCFEMADDFFDFIERGDRQLSNKNIIILDEENEVMQNYRFDLECNELSNLYGEAASDFYIYNQEITYENQKYLVTNLETRENGWRIINFVSVDILLEKEQQILKAALLALIVALSGAVLFTIIISAGVSRNLTLIEEGMKKIENGNFKTRIHPASYDEIGLLALQFNYMVLKIDDLIRTLANEQEEKQNAEFLTLQAQVNPHFLYNTLGSIKWLANSRGETEVEEMTDALIYLLKFSIKRAGMEIPVREELEYIKHYIRIQKARFGDAFLIIYDIAPETENCMMMGFVLQPLVENSLYHGIDMAAENGIVTVRTKIDNGKLMLEVSDNGIGFSEEELVRIMHEEKRYKGFNSIGIKIVNTRLKTYYGNDFAFEVTSREGVGTDIRIYIPCRVLEGEECNDY